MRASTGVRLGFRVKGLTTKPLTSEFSRIPKPQNADTQSPETETPKTDRSASACQEVSEVDEKVVHWHLFGTLFAPVDQESVQLQREFKIQGLRFKWGL